MSDIERSDTIAAMPGQHSGSAVKPGTQARRASAAKLSASRVYAAGSTKLRESAEALRDKAETAAASGAALIEDNPLAALAGAVALGAVAAAALPATDTELDAAGPLGDRVRTLLDGAVKTAKAAGLDHLASSGITAAGATTGIGGIIGGVVKAVIAANASKDSSASGSSEAKRATSPVPASG